MIYFTAKIKAVEYSDDKFVMHEKRRQRWRRNFCIGIIVIGFITLAAMLIFWK